MSTRQTKTKCREAQFSPDLDWCVCKVQLQAGVQATQPFWKGFPSFTQHRTEQLCSFRMQTDAGRATCATQARSSPACPALRQPVPIHPARRPASPASDSQGTLSRLTFFLLFREQSVPLAYAKNREKHKRNRIAGDPPSTKQS